MAKRQRGELGRPKPKKYFSPPPIPPAKPIPESERVTTAAPTGLLTKKQVLEILNVSHMTLRQMIKDGVIPPPRVIGEDGGRATTIRWIADEFFAAVHNAPRRLPGGAAGTNNQQSDREGSDES